MSFVWHEPLLGWALPVMGFSWEILGEIRWAEVASRPNFKRGQRMSQVQKAGLAYERRVARQAVRWWPKATIQRNTWIRFEDSSGIRYCCPDLLIFGARNCWLLEVKLSFVEEAELKVKELYLPLVQLIWGDRRWSSGAVCRHWRSGAAGFPGSRPGEGPFWTLWTG
jgi:hypothetical protein